MCHGIFLAAVPSPPGHVRDIPTPDAQTGLSNLSAALYILIDKSPFAADALATLRRNGRVIILYDPAFPEKTLGSYTVAAFKPTYFQRKGGEKGEFIAVIGRYGFKWSARELAGVIGHELIGQQYAPSETSLGYAYQNGRGLTPDFITAAKWYRKASGRGHAVAQFLLARLYDSGRGVARDPVTAYFWYGLARKHGKGNIATRARNSQKRLKSGLDKDQSTRTDARIAKWRPMGPV